ncbi:MAG: hypothetical protein IJX98_06540 [Clostridia bacterium]|nr:hypothetical protein [Clostridia bacterium]
MRNRNLWLGLALSIACCGSFTACAQAEQERSRYEIVAEYMRDGALTGTVKLDFFNCTENAIEVLKFNLYANAYRENALYSPISTALQDEAYYAGKSYGETVITSVLGVKSWEVGGADENILYAYLETPVYPDERRVVDIGFSTRLAKVDHRAGITKNAVNLGGCFPTLCGVQNGAFYESVAYAEGNPYFSDCADYTVSLTVPKDYAVASSGTETDEKTLESKKRHTVSATNARDFAIVLSENFGVKTEKAGKTEIAYYYFDEKNADCAVKLAKEAVEYYSSVFGEYPFETLSLAQTGLVEPSAEYPALCMLKSSLDGEELSRVIAQAVAHQWWYAAVGCNPFENAWQDEALAEYSAALFFEKHGDYGLNKQTLVKGALGRYKSYLDTYQKTLGWADTRMTRSLGEYLNAYEYESVAVDKGVVMLDTLSKSVGEKKFLAALRKYYNDNKYETATPAHLSGAFERIGLDVNGFFEGYLSGKGTF